VDAADADVVQASVVAQGDGSCLVDAVGADSVVGVDADGGVCFGSCGVDGGGGAVWLVVVVDEALRSPMNVGEIFIA
jgi:hypothetical protein